jgi:hypothetical protein
MRRKVLPAIALALAVCMTAQLPALTVAYHGYGYSGTPIKYGGWLVGQVYTEVGHVMQVVPWAKITVTNSYGNVTMDAYSNGYGWYRLYLPPGDYKVNATYAHYTQTYDVTIREDQIYRLLNVYILRTDMPEFQDRLASK